MRFKFIILSIVFSISTVFAKNQESDDLFGFEFSSATKSNTCPFANPVYRDLRDSAASLEKSLQLPAKCQEIQNQMSSIGKSLTTSVNELVRIVEFKKLNPKWDPNSPQPIPGAADASGAGGTPSILGMLGPPPSPSDHERIAAEAMNSVTELAQTFSKYSSQDDECGHALLQKTDYVGRILDTVSSIVPMAAAFSGPLGAPIALGSRAILSAASSLWKMYEKNKFRMEKAEERQALLSQSCAFYQMDRNIRWIERHKEGQTDIVTKFSEAADKAVQSYLQSAPLIPQPTDDVKKAAGLVRLAETRIADMTKAFEQTKNITGLNSQIVLQFLESGDFTKNLLDDLESMLKEDESVGIDTTVTRAVAHYFSQANQRSHFESSPSGISAKYSDERAVEWLNVFAQLIAFSKIEINRPGRLDLACLPEFKTRKDFDKTVTEATNGMNQLKDLLKYLQRLADEGQEFETAELMSARDRISSALFGNQSAFSPRGAATAWMNYMYRRTRFSLETFDKTRSKIMTNLALKPPPPLEQLLKEQQAMKDPNKNTITVGTNAHPACGIMEESALMWINARRHVQAMETYCRSFKHLIERPDFSEMAERCFSPKKTEGVFVLNGALSKTEPLTKKISKWLEEFHCRFDESVIGLIKMDPKSVAVTNKVENIVSVEIQDQKFVGLCKDQNKR
jgi:hypothetical protein